MYNIYEAYVGVYNYKRVIIWKVIKKILWKKKKHFGCCKKHSVPIGKMI